MPRSVKTGGLKVWARVEARTISSRPIRIAAARSGAALAWIAQLESDHGLRVCQLSVIENADATVNLEGKVAPRACNAA